jgi:hypothetical protein
MSEAQQASMQTAAKVKAKLSSWLTNSKINNGIVMSAGVFMVGEECYVEIGVPEAIDGIKLKFVQQGRVDSASIK